MPGNLLFLGEFHFVLFSPILRGKRRPSLQPPLVKPAASALYKPPFHGCLDDPDPLRCALDSNGCRRFVIQSPLVRFTSPVGQCSLPAALRSPTDNLLSATSLTRRGSASIESDASGADVFQTFCQPRRKRKPGAAWPFFEYFRSGFLV